jgi:hypothetical protein
MRMTIARLLLCAAVLASTGAVLAGSAFAASPALRVIAATGPTNLPPVSSEIQKVAVDATGGTFTLAFGAQVTPALDADADAADVAAALNALSSIGGAGGSVEVSGGGDVEHPYFVRFGGALAGTDVASLVADASQLTGGGASATVTVKAAGGQAGVGKLVVYVSNVGGAPTSGPVTMTIGPLPAGITTGEIPEMAGWECLPADAGQTSVTCNLTTGGVAMLNNSLPVSIPLRVGPGAAAQSSVRVAVEGGGSVPGPEGFNVQDVPIRVSMDDAEPGFATLWAGAFDDEGRPYTQAGGHPFSAGLFFLVNTALSPAGAVRPVGDLRDLIVDLPVGFGGNPMVTQRCPRELPVPAPDPEIDSSHCNAESIVGDTVAITSRLEDGAPLGGAAGLYNNVPPKGAAAALSFVIITVKQGVVATLRSDDYGVRTTVPNATPIYTVFGASTFLRGSPAAAHGKAFLTNPTECTGSTLPTFVSMSTWQAGTLFSDPVSGDSPPVTGCDVVPFDPSVDIEPTVESPDAASGLSFDTTVSQDGLLDPSELAQSHLKDVVVDLPEGMAVNPSGATGLKGCTDAQMAVGSNSAPQCPDGSKIGTVEVTSPLVDREIGGTMYLGTPKGTDPMSGDMLRLFVVVRDDELGVMIKLPGSATADPETGKLTATFKNNPRVPFDHLSVKLRGGDRGLLAMPQDCGSKTIDSSLAPWSATDAVDQSSPVDVAGDCTLGFGPSLEAGMSSQRARGSGAFGFEFSREDGEQWIDGLTAKLPKGLLASVRDVPLCSSGQAAFGACPDGSRIGSVDATAGSGNPFVLERKGSVYLTEGYKGCAYGLLVSVPVVAGPFDASSPETDLGSINVRQAVCVDPSTAEISAISDPLPTIWHGVPLRVRSVTVNVDRAGFMLNPSDCSAKQTAATFGSERGAVSNTASPFFASDCAALGFEPNLTLALTGRKQVTTGKHPGVKAKVTQQGVSEAGIEKAVVRLPKSLALDPNNAQALCEYVDGTKPDLENHCPKGSIVGRARAKTPLLKNDLAGNVYFVKNIRIDPKTGNQIRTLPMIIVALRGEIAVNLKGESSTTKAGRLVNTFANVPDAPISQFNLNIQGGNNGILAVTRTRKAKINLCAGRHIAESDMDGHNGRRHDTNVRMKTPCTRKQTKAAKRAAKQATRRR